MPGPRKRAGGANLQASFASWLRNQGWTWVHEAKPHRVRFRDRGGRERVRNAGEDLFGVWDLLAVHAGTGDHWYVQTTTPGHVAARVAKIVGHGWCRLLEGLARAGDGDVVRLSVVAHVVHPDVGDAWKVWDLTAGGGTEIELIPFERS